MIKLKQLNIGANSFTQKRKYWGTNPSKSFHIINCESLKSIEIGENSFSDYSGAFELKNLNSLQSIKIGLMTCESLNFYSCTLQIRGMNQ